MSETGARNHVVNTKITFISEPQDLKISIAAHAASNNDVPVKGVCDNSTKLMTNRSNQFKSHNKNNSTTKRESQGANNKAIKEVAEYFNRIKIEVP